MHDLQEKAGARCIQSFTVGSRRSSAKLEEESKVRVLRRGSGGKGSGS
jgi:hypothetical protein